MGIPETLDRDLDEPRPRSSRRLLWAGCLIIWTLVVLRLTTQLAADVRQRAEATAPIDDPGLMDLMVNVAVYLAAVVSLVLTALYLSLCRVVDDVVFPGLIRGVLAERADGTRPGLGPASTVGLLAAAPVHAVAWATGAAAPKDHPATYLWLVVLAVGIAWTWPRHAARVELSISKTWLLTGVLVVVAAVSLII